jgi:preprotein translocase subunit SecG
MLSFLNALTVISALLIIVAVLVQNQGSGLGDAFGGGGGNVYRSKRGFEKGLFVFTIILAVVFVASILARFLVA